jgi:hypothetical protein
MINITGNFLNQILELFSTGKTVPAPSMSGILKLAILSTINILERSLIKNKCVNV